MKTSRAKRIVIPEGALRSGDLCLTGDIAKHVARVLRRESGDPLDISDGAGRRAPAIIERVSREEVFLRVGSIEYAPRKDPDLVLFQGLAKGDKMDLVVRQATELGVTQIQPVVCARSMAGGRGRVERWRAIAEDAVRVSGRAFRPRILGVVPLVEALATVRAPLRIVLTPTAREGLSASLKPGSCQEGAVLLVGPEGGFTADEVALSAEHGFVAAHLGDRVLRTETAGSAVLAVLQFVRGGFERECSGFDSG